MALKTPILIINFKTYKESTGNNALKLARICDSLAKRTKKSIAIAVQPIDLQKISNAVSIPVFAQHIDGITYGAHTGHILAEDIKQAGSIGSILNHSEDQFMPKELKLASEKLKELKMQRVICANTPKKAKDIAKLTPEFIAIEPPQLIGGKISVSTAKPEIIKNTVDIVKKTSPKTKVLCGAGVHTAQDVKIALKLGAKGVLVASGIIKAKDQKKAILELINGFI